MANDIKTGRFKGRVSTKSGTLTVRDYPSTNGNPENYLAHGSTAHEFQGYYLNGSSEHAAAWLLTYVNGALGTPNGYVSARYITWIPSYGVGTEGSFSTTVDVPEGEYVNVRQLPDKKSTSIGILHRGDPVLVLYRFDSPNYGWTHVATSVGTGWIMTEFLDGRG